jgi:hypothetical protein
MLNRIGLTLLVCVSLASAAARSAAAADEPAASDSSALIGLGRDLKLEVMENGPEELWTLQLSNLGSTPIELIADAGLLWFQVTLPGKAAPDVCRLPEPLWPKTMRRRAHMELGAGQKFSRRFDPRFFCFAELDQKLLVPGATVKPLFGWPHETEVSTRGGKRTVNALPPRPPFVAWVKAADPAPPSPSEQSEAADKNSADQNPAESDTEQGGDIGAWETPKEGIKLLEGPTLVLSSLYAEWSRPVPSDKLSNVTLLMVGGSDAEDEKSATVAVAPFNGSPVPQLLFVRRDLIDYQVEGPDGSFECESAEIGAPDFASFATLAPGKGERMVVRLIEICPRGSFTRPGLYTVRASFDARWSGQTLGLEAFTGRLTTPRPALVRVRGGDRSSFFRAAAPLLTNEAAAPGGLGVPPPPGGALPLVPSEPAPGDGVTPDGSQEDAPAGHDLPDEAAPPQEAPQPDTTTVE